MNQQKLTVTALFQARPGKETALRTALIKLIGPTLKEQGCLNRPIQIVSVFLSQARRENHVEE